MNLSCVSRLVAVLFFCFADFNEGHAAPENDLSPQIARLPWDAVVQTNATAADAQIKVTCHFEEKGVVTDTEVHHISVAHAQTYIGPDGKKWIRSSTSSSQMKCRDGIGVWCNGGGRIVRADQNGFDYCMRLTWQKNGEKVIHLEETFPGRWVKSQTFDRQGMHVTIEVEMEPSPTAR